MRASGLFNVIVFYDLDLSKVDVKGWYEYTLDVFKKYGKVPTRMGLGAENYEKSKTMTFKGGDKKLRSLNFEKIHDISVYATIPDNDYDADDVYISSSIDIHDGKSATLIFHVQDAVIPYSHETYEQIIQEMEAYVPFDYGIVYRMDYEWGPAWYPYPAAAGKFTKMTDEENEAYAKKDNKREWFIYYATTKKDDPDRFKPYELRNIYPMNLLTKSHLEHDVVGQTLRQFIESDPAHGELKPISEKITSWRVADENIDMIREKLRPANILVSARPLKI